MAFVTPKKLGQAAVGTGAGTLIYTAPTDITTLVKDIDVCNTTTGALTLTVCLVPLAGSATTANALFYAITIPASGQYQWTGTQILNTGGFIQAIASGAGLTLNAAGGEYVV